MIVMRFWNKNIFGGKLGVATTLAPKGLGSQDPTKTLAHRVELFGKPLSQKMFLKIKGLNPLFY